MKKLLVVSVFAFATLSSHAQVNDKIGAEPDEIKAMARKTLVVELPEENAKVIDSFSKKTAAADAAAYRASLASYREQIEPAIRKYWQYNKNIEFKTTSEVVALFEKKSTKYVALLKVVLADGGGAYGYTFGLGVPAIVLTRTDGDSKVTKKGQLELRKYDYQMYLVTTPAEDGTESYSEAGMKFTLTQAQKHMEWIGKSSKSKTYHDYCKEMAKSNCSKLASKDLMVADNGLYKSVDKSEAVESYGKPIDFAPAADLEKAYLDATPGKAVLISLPIGTVGGSLLVVTIVKLAYMKVVVDTETNTVLNAIVPGVGKSYVEGVAKMDLRQLADCK